MRYVVYKDPKQQYRWRLVAPNGRVIADSGEGYYNRSDCVHGVNLVAGSAGTPIHYI